LRRRCLISFPSRRSSDLWTALVLLTEIRRAHPYDFRITSEGFTQMIGSRWAREAFDRGEDPTVIWDRWEEEREAWERRVRAYRLDRKSTRLRSSHVKIWY